MLLSILSWVFTNQTRFFLLELQAFCQRSKQVACLKYSVIRKHKIITSTNSALSFLEEGWDTKVINEYKNIFYVATLLLFWYTSCSGSPPQICIAVSRCRWWPCVDWSCFIGWGGFLVLSTVLWIILWDVGCWAFWLTNVCTHFAYLISLSHKIFLEFGVIGCHAQVQAWLNAVG